jgi:redox-sensitive bicupin YhaK (pirin superfamily)
MTTGTHAKIFLADERGLHETASSRSLQTFSFGKYYDEHKQAVGDIYLLNDDWLDGGCSLSMPAAEDSFVVLLPVVGAVIYRDSLQHENIIAAGQVQIFRLNKGAHLSVSNAFKNQAVNFLQVWMRPAGISSMTAPMINTYDVNAARGNLLQIFTAGGYKQQTAFTASIGKFKGRDETVYRSRHQNNTIFIFVLEGAFEVAGRLLHARDGLALWQTGSIDMEALSNDALLLLIEQHS